MKNWPLTLQGEKTMKENAPSYVPVFKGEVEGYVANHLKKNMWRVAKSMEYQDVMQEAYLCFLQVAKWYEGKIVNAAHFMAIYKKAWHDTFFHLAYSSSKVAKEKSTAPTMVEKVVTQSYNYGPLLVKINSAPEEIKDVLRILFTAPAEVLAVFEQELKMTSQKTCGINKALCKLIGADPNKVNLKTQLMNYLST